MQAALAPEGAAGSGPAVPDRTDHVAVAGRADGDDPARLPAGEVAPVRSRSRATARRLAGEQAAGSRDHTSIYHFDKADVVVVARRRFPRCGPGSVRYQKDFADRRRVTDERKEMNRLYAIESTPTLTGAKADHRLVLKARRDRGVRARAVGRRRQRPRRRLPRPSPGASVPRPARPDTAKWVAARRQGPAGAPRPFAGRRGGLSARGGARGSRTP